MLPCEAVKVEDPPPKKNFDIVYHFGKDFDFYIHKSFSLRESPYLSVYFSIFIENYRESTSKG